MNADEIVRALRMEHSHYDGHGHYYLDYTQKQFNAILHESADLIENLQVRLAESQRREQAAVEDAKQGSVCRTCHYLNNGCDPLNLDAGCHKWQWRGPGAGEGAAK